MARGEEGKLTLLEYRVELSSSRLILATSHI